MVADETIKRENKSVGSLTEEEVQAEIQERRA